ncbi:MAG: nitroreductase family protein [Bifidobacteriaceae bacterium]|jgi:SagB-type dehydrogenase family enzyme|nr:nitroreductase family protein [Bifidobacteriaceae bacterium]
MAKYLHRGYRFALYDCGALTQSLYLAGTALDLDTCVVGGIYDDELSRFLGVNSVEEPAQLAFLVGPRSSGCDPEGNPAS